MNNKIKNKKAVAVNILILIIIGVVVAALLIYYFSDRIGIMGTETNKLLIQRQYESCLTASKDGTLTKINDQDEDRLWDVCDNCLCPKEQGGCHNTLDDNDGDMIPLRCDVKQEKKEKEDTNSLYQFNQGCIEKINKRKDRLYLCHFVEAKPRPE